MSDIPTPRTDAASVLVTHCAKEELCEDWIEAVDADFARTLERENYKIRDKLAAVTKAAGFCDKHKPNGGARNCLVCGCEALSFALHKISCLCGKPNEHGISDFAICVMEDRVVEQVEKLVAERDELAAKLERVQPLVDAAKPIIESQADTEQRQNLANRPAAEWLALWNQQQPSAPKAE